MDQSTEKTNFRVLHVVPSLELEQGGLPVAAYSLARWSNKFPGIEVNLISQARDLADTIELYPECLRPHILLSGRIDTVFGWSMRKKIKSILKNHAPDIIHVHGLWVSSSFWAADLALDHGVPLVIHPHGMLEPWALQQKSIKKKIALKTYQRRMLERAAILVATSEVELQSLRDLGFNRPIAILPHGVDVHLATQEQKKQVIGGRRKALFMSRIHPKKGLLELMDAWREISKEFPNWDLQIAGGFNDKGYFTKVKKFVLDNKLSGSVFFLGHISSDLRHAVMADADLFVLPSFSENFGLVVLDALSNGLPVITTKATPWTELGKTGVGWSTEVGIEPLKDALRHAMKLPHHVLIEMGQAGVEYSKRFSWAHSADKLVKVYRWLHGSDICPDFVRLLSSNNQHLSKKLDNFFSEPLRK